LPELFSDRLTKKKTKLNPDRNLEQVLPELFSDRFAFQDPDVKLKGIENYASECPLCLPKPHLNHF
jgi:hypothetical protein